MTTTLDTPPTYADVPPVDLDWLAGRALQLATSPQAWRHLVQPADAGRWYAPMAVDEQSEAWLMGWPAWERIELHDHGGSCQVGLRLAGLVRSRVGVFGLRS
jgi:hypothetical protein